MADPQPSATPAPMEGQGGYNRASAVQASGAWPALPLFRAANRMNAYNTYLLMEQEARR